MIQLSDRLAMAASFVTPGNRVADVGCDHAYMSIYLREQGISPHVVAMDVRKGPLERAKQNIEKAGRAEEIELRLSDGLEKLLPGETDAVLLCGMGGLLMIKILSDHPEVTESMKELILQPQSEVSEVRRFLHNLSYEITKEGMIKEDGKYYVMMRAVKVTVPQHYEDWEYAYGKLLIEQGDEVLFEFLDRETRLREAVLAEMETLHTPKAESRREDIAQELEVIRVVRKRVILNKELLPKA